MLCAIYTQQQFAAKRIKHEFVLAQSKTHDILKALLATYKFMIIRKGKSPNKQHREMKQSVH